MINIFSEAGKQRELQRLLRLGLKFERALSKKLTAVINKQYARQAGYLNRGIIDVGLAVTSYRSEMEEIMEKHYLAVGHTYGQEAIDQAKSIRGVLITKKPSSDFADAIKWWAKHWAAEKIKDINSVTKSKLKRIITNGAEAGLDFQSLAKKVLSTGKIQNPVRAEKIARTETHTASVYATHEGMVATGLVLNKEWVAMNDDRTRDTHKEAHGQTVPINGFYKVGGEIMARPGDPTASPENIINCRCVELYKTK